MLRTMMAAAVAAGALLVAAPASAATLYDSGDGTRLWTTLGETTLAGARFVFDDDVTLTGIEGFIQPLADTDFTVSIYSEGLNGRPAAVLHSATFSNDGAAGPAAWMGATSLDWDLTSGVYWVVFGGANANAISGFLWGAAPTPVERYAAYLGQGAWQKTPKTAAFGIRLSGEGPGQALPGDAWPQSPGGIPEPASWALMIMGFGAAGAMLRRRPLTLAQ